MLGIFRADYVYLAVSAHDFAILAHFFYAGSYFHLILLIILPRVKSYGVTATITLSPGKTLILFTLILPAI